MGYEKYKQYIVDGLQDLDETDVYFIWQIATLVRNYLEEKQGRQET